LLEALSQSFDQLRRIRKPPATTLFDSTFASRHPMRILMADDSRVNQKVGNSFLEKLGYRAEVVSNGFEVLDAFESPIV
jgi:PleD family two-component response regulator